MKPMRQFQLRDGTSRYATWLPDDKRLRPGARVTLKDSADPSRWWTVAERGHVVLGAESIHRDWRVGGLL